MTIRTPMHPMGGGQSKLPAGIIIFESATPGSYTVVIPTTQNYTVIINGAGGGNTSAVYGFYSGGTYYGGYGGSVQGTCKINKGTYTVDVGGAGYPNSIANTAGTVYGGTGGTSAFYNNYAYGGGGAASSIAIITAPQWLPVFGGGNGGAGGTSVVTPGLVGYTGYGSGPQGNGYVKIVTAQ